MRFVVKFRIPVEKFNTAVRDGSAGRKIEQILANTKPEAVYFWEEAGRRGGIMAVNLREGVSDPGHRRALVLVLRRGRGVPSLHDVPGARRGRPGCARQEVRRLV